MADEVLVKMAMANLSPVVPTLQIVLNTHTLAQAPSGPFCSMEIMECLLQSDIDAAFASYTTPYTNPPYSAPGTLMYQSLKSISGLSALIKKNDEAVALVSSEGTITCSLVSPALDSNGVADSTPSYDLDFSFTDAGQHLCTSDA